MVTVFSGKHKTMGFTLPLVISCVMLSATMLWSQVPETKDERVQEEPEVITLHVSLAEEPDPALQHRLWPDELTRKPGNAAPFYYRAMLMLSQKSEKERTALWKNYDAWSELPPEKLPLKEVKKQLVDLQPNVFAQLHEASMRKECNWSLGVEDLTALRALGFLLPEMQEVRTLCRLLALQARVQIAEGDFQAALETMQIGFRLAHDIAKEPLLVNGLVGIACESLMYREVEHFISQPNAPNLYWGLSSLPRPLIDLHPAMNYELSMMMRVFPSAKDLDRKRSQTEWDALLKQMISDFTSMSDQWSLNKTESARKKWGKHLAAVMIVTTAYPAAKQRLLASKKYTPAAVQNMAGSQVVILDMMQTYQHIHHEFLKWRYLSHPGAMEKMLTVEKQLKKEGYLGEKGKPSREIIPLASLLVPAIVQTRQAEMRTERRRNLLRTIELLRMQAATQFPKETPWPETLSELDDVMLPRNPVTNAPFKYDRKENTARIFSNHPLLPHTYRNTIYELKPRQDR